MNALRLAVWAALAVLAWRVIGGSRAAEAGHVSVLLGVLACLAGILVLGWRRGGGTWPVPTKGGARGFRMAAWLCLAVMMLFWLGVASKRPVQAMVTAWEYRFDPPPASESTAEQSSEQTTGHMDWDEGSRRALPRTTNIKPGKKPEVFLRIEDRAAARRLSKRPIYLSSIAYDQYVDSAWHIATQSPGELQPDASGEIRLEDDGREDGIWHTIVMSAEAKRRSPLVALQGVTRVEGLDSLERWSPALHLLPAPEKAQDGYRYRARSFPMGIRDIAGGDLCEPDGSHDPAWLRLPDDALMRRLIELTKSVAGDGPLPERARRIQEHLNASYRYSLSTANPLNLDPLENFLFGEKSGHCEYFATAGALMARAAGIPSRVMYGWAGGTWYEHADWFVFRADEAHVWVELYLGGHGWVVMDPTPPEALRSQAMSTSGETLPAMPGADGGELAAHLSHESSKAMPWIASALIAVAGIAVLLRPTARAAARFDPRIVPEPWREPAGLAYFEEWQKAVAPRLPHRALGSLTMRQQIHALHPAPDFAEDLLGYHYRVRYEGEPRDRAREKNLTRRIRAWTAAASSRAS